MCNYTFRFTVALLTFAVGISTVYLFRIYRYYPPQPSAPQVAINSNATPGANSLEAAEWQEIVTDRFSFNLPGDMLPHSLYGWEETPYNRTFSNHRRFAVKYWYGVGPCVYPIPGTSRAGYEVKAAEVDGMRVHYRIDRYDDVNMSIAQICFPRVGRDKARLSMMAYGEGGQTVKDAERVFTSVRFTR